MEETHQQFEKVVVQVNLLVNILFIRTLFRGLKVKLNDKASQFRGDEFEQHWLKKTNNQSGPFVTAALAWLVIQSPQLFVYCTYMQRHTLQRIVNQNLFAGHQRFINRQQFGFGNFWKHCRKLLQHLPPSCQKAQLRQHAPQFVPILHLVSVVFKHPQNEPCIPCEVYLYLAQPLPRLIPWCL